MHATLPLIFDDPPAAIAPKPVEAPAPPPVCTHREATEPAAMLPFTDRPYEPPPWKPVARKVKARHIRTPSILEWLDDGQRIAARRRDSRRILIGRALKLVAMGDAADCRDGWKRVRALYEAGKFTLPANV